MLILFILTVFPCFSQAEDLSTKGPGFFIGVMTEGNGYGREGIGFGGGLLLGMGDANIGIGLRALYIMELGESNISAMEIAIFLRVYLFGADSPTGFFIQADGGAFILSYDEDIYITAPIGGFSGGITFGYRFPLGNHWFVEPILRAGYPYIAAAGVSFGYKF